MVDTIEDPYGVKGSGNEWFRAFSFKKYKILYENGNHFHNGSVDTVMLLSELMSQEALLTGNQVLECLEGGIIEEQDRFPDRNNSNRHAYRICPDEGRVECGRILLN